MKFRNLVFFEYFLNHVLVASRTVSRWYLETCPRSHYLLYVAETNTLIYELVGAHFLSAKICPHIDLLTESI